MSPIFSFFIFFLRPFSFESYYNLSYKGYFHFLSFPWLWVKIKNSIWLLSFIATIKIQKTPFKYRAFCLRNGEVMQSQEGLGGWFFLPYNCNFYLRAQSHLVLRAWWFLQLNIYLPKRTYYLFDKKAQCWSKIFAVGL